LSRRDVRVFLKRDDLINAELPGGSDLHMLQHGQRWVERAEESNAPFTWFDPTRDVLMGHEFAAEVVELGTGVEGFSSGQHVVALPGIPR
jgi:threonine dehydrogenase-like Zn-dependent dehydrogenase